MRKHYPWLLFDADDTLFDYQRAECLALERAFRSAGLDYAETNLELYRRINQGLWEALERQEITSETLRVRRFELLLENLRLTYSPMQLSAAYLGHLAQCAELIEGAADVLHSLAATCRLAIVTNGLQAVQRSRLAHSSIRDTISDLIISEEIGAAKPSPAFFVTAFARLGNPAKSEALLVGDSLSSDMQGGIGYGIDTCWYNPTGQPRPGALAITYEIAHLRDLLEIVT
ncbi:MAG TPA: YjjG family noncanonical pyrimidine nucleotidase [Anaerolineaceae bacterium]